MAPCFREPECLLAGGGADDGLALRFLPFEDILPHSEDVSCNANLPSFQAENEKKKRVTKIDSQISYIFPASQTDKPH